MPVVNQLDPLSSRARWLARLPFRLKLALLVGIPSLIALLGSLLTLGRVASAYQRAQILEKANAASTLLIRAATAQAKERGFTAAVLSDPTAQATRSLITDLRRQGDDLLDEAMGVAQPALRGNRVLAEANRELQEARQERDRRRAVADAALLREQIADQALVQAWFDAQTRLIQAERVFGGALFLAQNPYELVIQYNGFIKANVFVASEFAGRERARIGRFIGSGAPIPLERLDELQRWRGVVDENIAAILQLRANPAMSKPVLDSIDEMQRVFLGGYQQTRTAVYVASARHEPYPLTTDQWITVSTQGINSIIAVSDRIGDEAARISRQQATFSLVNVLLIVGMMSLLGLAVVASVFVARHLARRLGELRAAAERISQGDYSQPLGEANAPGVSDGDEFAGLAAAFNAMQNRVQTGVAQLRSEKVGVEARVTERTRELRSANDRLLALNEEKNTFLGVCSHDLKNPLSGIVGLATLIHDDTGSTPQAREYAADILHSSEFMFQLVTNLLDLGAIEQGRFNLKPEPVALPALLTRVVDSYWRLATDKRIQLELRLPDDEIILMTDARVLQQIVDNLVSNAVKYTPPEGEIEVRLESKDAVAVEISVRDTGPGLSEADQTHLFQKYVRLTPQPTGNEHSTGLGLSIVKQMAEAMGGSVSCRSNLGQGSTFAVRLPAASTVSQIGV